MLARAVEAEIDTDDSACRSETLVTKREFSVNIICEAIIKDTGADVKKIIDCKTPENFCSTCCNYHHGTSH